MPRKDTFRPRLDAELVSQLDVIGEAMGLGRQETLRAVVGLSFCAFNSVGDWWGEAVRGGHYRSAVDQTVRGGPKRSAVDRPEPEQQQSAGPPRTGTKVALSSSSSSSRRLLEEEERAEAKALGESHASCCVDDWERGFLPSLTVPGSPFSAKQILKLRQFMAKARACGARAGAVSSANEAATVRSDEWRKKEREHKAKVKLEMEEDRAAEAAAGAAE